MKSILRSGGLCTAILSMATVSCGDGEGVSTSAGSEFAEVELALSNVPTGVLCVKVSVTAGSQTVTSSVSVTGGSSSANLNLGPLPTGAATFLGNAYSVACSSVSASTTASWIADAVTTTLAPGLVSKVALNFRQNNSVAANANFASNIAAIETGAEATYARMADGSVMQWGKIAAIDFGDSSDVHYLTPAAVPGLSNVTQVVGFYDGGCALKGDGSVWCWGAKNDQNRWPSSIPMGLVLTPVQIQSAAASPIKNLVARGRDLCAVTNDARVFCWQNGNPVETLYNVSSFSLGYFHRCTIYPRDGGLICSGLNTYGQLGTNASGTTGLVGVRSVVEGGYHTCAVMADRTVRCFGANYSGQLGDGTFIDRSTPVQVAGLENVVQLEAGESHTCALVQNGSVYCWGFAAYLGGGSAQNGATPVLVPGLSGVTAIHAGLFHTCAEAANHSVKCWGSNWFGQIGDGTSSYAASPTSSLL